MSKGTKIAIVVAVILVVLGCVIGGLGFAMSGGELAVNTEYREKFEKHFTGHITKIETELHYELMELTVIPGDEYVVEYYDNEKNYFNVELDGDTLRVTRNEVNSKWYENIDFGFGGTDFGVRIGVPAKFYGEVELKTGSGHIFVAGLTLEKPLTAENGSGGVNIVDVYCAELAVEVGSGGIGIENTSVMEGAALSSESGAIEAEELRCGGVFKAEAGSGALRLDSCTADSFDFKTGSGGISFEDCAYESSAVIRAGSGSVRGELPGRERDYSIRSDTGSGSCNLPDYTEAGDKLLEVRTGSGSINIEFDRD